MIARSRRRRRDKEKDKDMEKEINESQKDINNETDKEMENLI